MKIKNIDKETAAIIVIVAIIVVLALAYAGGYIGKAVAYSSEREASEAITVISNAVEQIRSIIESIDEALG